MKPNQTYPTVAEMLGECVSLLCFVALYGPPVNRFDPTIVDTVGWPGGRYVFAIRAPGYERWWGVDVEPPGEIAPPRGVAPRGEPGPTPAIEPDGGAAASPEAASP